MRALAGRRDAGPPVPDAEPARRLGDGGLAVAGQELDREAARGQCSRPPRRHRRARGPSKREAHRRVAWARQPQLGCRRCHRRRSRSPSRGGRGAPRPRAWRAPGRSPAPPARLAPPARRVRPGRRRGRADAGWRRRGRPRAPAPPAAQRAASTRTGRPSVSVPVLSKHDGVDLSQALERGRRLEEHAPAHEPAAGDHLHRRHGEPERAGAGDDEHRHGVQQRRLPSGSPRQGSSRGRSPAPGRGPTGA